MKSTEFKDKKLKDYLKDQTIGKGSFGKVIKALHKPTNQYVAIKIFKIKKINKQIQSIIKKEIEVMKLVSHPNIIQLYQTIQTHNSIYMIMQYAEEGDLYQYIVNKNKLNLQQTKRIIIQLAQAVHYLHQIGIAHRDLKPENVLLDSKHNVKLADFGLSGIFRSKMYLQTPCGSCLYSAPEMLYKSRYEPVKVDAWSFGVILYACVLGYLPFESQDMMTLYQNITQCRYQMPVSLQQNLQNLIKRILVPNPKDRMSIYEILQHQFLNDGLVHHRVVKKQIPIAKQLISIMQKNNYPNILNQLKSRHHNKATVYYWLSLKTTLEIRGLTVFQYLTTKKQGPIKFNISSSKNKVKKYKTTSTDNIGRERAKSNFYSKKPKQEVFKMLRSRSNDFVIDHQQWDDHLQNSKSTQKSKSIRKCTLMNQNFYLNRRRKISQMIRQQYQIFV